MVCRVFQKSAAKKYPTSQSSRTVNPYNLEIGPSVIASPMMQLGDPTQFPYGRNFMSNPAELAELSRVFRGGSSSTSGANLSIPSHLNYPVGGGYFTMSGLNLNLGGTPTQPVFRPMPPPPGPSAMNQHDIITSSISMMTSTGGGSLGAETSYGTDLNNNVAPNGPPSNRSYMNMEQCMDLDHYWPTY